MVGLRNCDGRFADVGDGHRALPLSQQAGRGRPFVERFAKERLDCDVVVCRTTAEQRNIAAGGDVSAESQLLSRWKLIANRNEYWIFVVK